MFDQALVQQLCARLARVSNNMEKTVLGCLFFSFYLNESNSKTIIKNLEMIGADLLFVQYRTVTNRKGAIVEYITS